jgi:hypothetical protein
MCANAGKSRTQVIGRSGGGRGPLTLRVGVVDGARARVSPKQPNE